MKLDTTEKHIIFVDGTKQWRLAMDETGVSVPRVGEHVNLPDEDVQLRCYEVVGVDYFYRELPHDPRKNVAPLAVRVRLKKKESVSDET